MSIFETTLIFVVIPVGFMAIVAALVFASGRRNEPDRRYRPGRPFDFEPIWFVSSPSQLSSAAPAKAIESGAVGSSAGTPARPAAVGGASDRW